jgi:hypothetical protein
VGAGNSEDDGGYAAKVMAEHSRLKLVSTGRSVPASGAQVTPTVAQPKAESTSDKVAALFNS